MTNEPIIKKFSFSHNKDLNQDNDLLSSFLQDSNKENRDDLNSMPQSLQSLRVQTPTFSPNRLNSQYALKGFEDRELDLFSPKIQALTAKLRSISLPDRIQLVKRIRLDYYGKIKYGFDIHSMDQSLELEESLFNHDEFSIDFGGLDLLEFLFKKAEGIKVDAKQSTSDILVDQKTLEKFKFKNFAIGLSVGGEARRIGHIKKIGGVYLIMNVDDEVRYKIQKVDNFVGKCQRVFILNEKEDVVGGLDLMHLNENTLTCTVLFPPDIGNLDKLLIIGTVFILMWKISPLKGWMNRLNQSKGSFIFQFIKKMCGKLCPKHR